MIRKLKNKGYMLVEIILAFVLAIGVTYFMFELIIKLKNKNDDLIVKTLVATDQAIIYNTIMQDLITSNSFDCSNIEIENNKFKYNNEYVSDISDYAGVGSVFCDKNGNNVSIKIPINVNQLKDTFDINIKYTLDEVTSIPTTLTPSPPSTTPTPSSGSASVSCSCNQYTSSGLIVKFEIGDYCYCCPIHSKAPNNDCATFYKY